MISENESYKIVFITSNKELEQLLSIKLTLKQDEILEALELEGVHVERLPAELHPTGTPGRRIISPAAIAKNGISQYSLNNLGNLASRETIHSFRIFGKYYFGGRGIIELMEHEEKALEGGFPRGARIGSNRGGGSKQKS